MRLEQAGLRTTERFIVPVTQEQLGDTMGLTSVHVNRVLQRMQSEGLISIGRGQLTILKAECLREIAEFDPNYLHLDRRR